MKHLTECLALLRAAFPQGKLSRETVELYAWALQDIPESVLRAAVSRLVCSARWMPTIAEIRAEATTEALAAIPGVDVAWREFLSKAGRENPTWSHPAITAAVRECGYKWLCQTDERWGRKRFAEVYAEVRRADALLPPKLRSPVLELGEGDD